MEERSIRAAPWGALVGALAVLHCASGPGSGSGQPGGGGFTGGSPALVGGAFSGGAGGASVGIAGGGVQGPRGGVGGAGDGAAGTAASGRGGASGGVPEGGGPFGSDAGSAGRTPAGGRTTTGAVSGGHSAGGTSAAGEAQATGSAGQRATSGGASGAGASAGGVTSGGTAGATSAVPLDPTLLDKCTGTNPIRCTLTAPNGSYDVSVELGDAASSGSSRVQAETRHTVSSESATAAGAYAIQTFSVNVRQEQHDGGQSAPGNVLDLSIDGSAPRLHGLGVRASPSAVTVFIASDSTACDWVATNTSASADDQTGWAQVLSMYLKPGVTVANYADSGETAAAFYSKFFPAARSAMKAGDYLFIQFGHNDQKNAADVDGYSANLLKYVNDARQKSVTPVILTPVSRSSGTAANPGFNGLDQQARDLAAKENVALIDLTALSRTYYATVPDKNALFIDGTHFHEVGAIGVAGVVAQALKSSNLSLSAFVK